MNDLLTRTWYLLQNNWILLSVLIVESLVQLIFKGGKLGPGNNMMLEIALYFFHLAVLAGWLYQMKVVLMRENHRSTWDDFLNGVARYFNVLMGGGGMFFFLIFMGFMLSVMLAQMVAGMPDEGLLQKVTEFWQAGKTAEIERLIQDNQEAVQQLSFWVMTLLVGLFLVAVYAVSLSFWTYWAVLSNLNWPQAWRSSQATVKKHWKSLTYLGLICLVPTAIIIAGFFSGNPVVQFVAYFASLLAKVYFSLLFMQFLFLAEPELITPLLENTPDKPLNPRL